MFVCLSVLRNTWSKFLSSKFMKNNQSKYDQEILAHRIRSISEILPWDRKSLTHAVTGRLHTLVLLKLTLMVVK